MAPNYDGGTVSSCEAAAAEPEAARGDWWADMVGSVAVHSHIGALIDGLDEIADLAIPYGRLPRRAHTAYASDLRVWSDLAATSVDELLRRPKAGEATARAMVTAAKDTVRAYRGAATKGDVTAAAAVQRLVDQLDERDRIILSTRVWATRPQPQRVVAERLGVDSVSIRRNQPRAEVRFSELLDDPWHHSVSTYARWLQARLGPYVPADVVAGELRALAVDPDSEIARVLLHVAGPYVRRGQWLEHTTAGGHRRVQAAIDAVFQTCGAPSAQSLRTALTELGMPAEAARRFLTAEEELRRVGDVYVRWGRSLPERAEAVLHAAGAPMTPDAIFAAIDNGEAASVRGLREALYADDRFVRASRLTWALRAWGLDEYTSILDAIETCLAAAGGLMNVEDLIRAVRARFGDVAETSIRTYLGTRGFITEAGTVRRRTDNDKWPTTPPLNTVPGAFRNGRNEIRLTVPVTVDVLRGSGVHLRAAAAAAVQVSPGERRDFTGPYGQISVIWRLTSPNGPGLSSLRAAANAVGAELRDSLVLVFRLDTATVDVVRVGAEKSGMALLGALLGRRVRSPVAALASSLNCRREEVTEVLYGRGDDDLAALVAESTAQPDI